MTASALDHRSEDGQLAAALGVHCGVSHDKTRILSHVSFVSARSVRTHLICSVRFHHSEGVEDTPLYRPQKGGIYGLTCYLFNAKYAARPH